MKSILVSTKSIYGSIDISCPWQNHSQSGPENRPQKCFAFGVRGLRGGQVGGGEESHRSADRLERPGRRPRSFQDIQTDLCARCDRE